MIQFDLNPRLEGDSLPVADLALCALRLMKDANYPWLLLIPRQPDLIEILDLAPADRLVLMEEIAAAAEALKGATGCDKLNIAALGNQVSQLHVHVIARFQGDAAWPDPVWGREPPAAYADGDRERLVAAVRERLGC
ncbi:HIT domain-containing protein [Polymorphum gilvum]|uniref:Diadenosine tetraphosphate (Ap4A) hydrolase-liker H IT family hydrolase n=1 Tax=Polymorphum gilvum (strain LMG 25793 / CGMCC 1.9160 / SL003B-26A1) TaxID=991905 RepID=F2IVI1_POLGS|nr:HIT family protein [Polymorphum gilvum]ADZ72699.1 Diadenosine tetraphosphate (Ap4A) hydrolase-liker H IT family hydrolase [Polymorphum gilvum SL003B-26A1]